MKQGHLFIISGPSGVGKNSIINYLMDSNPEFKQVPSFTTRPAREEDNISGMRKSITKGQFETMIKNDLLVEWKETHGFLYGKKKQDIQTLLDDGHIIILEIDVKGIEEYKKQFKNTHLIFLQYPSLEELKVRLKKCRNNIADDELGTRLETAKNEMKYADQYNYIITTYTVDAPSIPGKKIEKIIKEILDTQPENQV